MRDRLEAEHASLTPTEAKVAWATERTRSGAHLLALTLALKCFQRLGYFPRADDIPALVVDHVRHCLDLPEGTPAAAGARSAKAHRELVRTRLGVVHDPRSPRATSAGTPSTTASTTTCCTCR
jgi:hypothetical protein